MREVCEKCAKVKNIMKKISENIWEFDPQIYPQLLWVSVNPTKEEQKVFNTTYEEPEIDLNLDLTDCNAQVNNVRLKENRRTGSLITFKSIEQINCSNIAHEASHVVFDLCSVRDIRTHYDNQEPVAYLIGWVADCCEKVKNEICKQN